MKLSYIILSYFLKNIVSYDNIVIPLHYENQCEEPFILKKDNQKHFRRHISEPEILKKDSQKAKKMAKLVAKEMGADYRLLLIWMERGSNSNPYAVHVMDGDVRAHKKAWKQYIWSQPKERYYLYILKNKNINDSEWWKAKSNLNKILRYKNNLFFRYKKPVDILDENHNILGMENVNVFYMGYGPIDMNSVLYSHIWNNNTPPWVMCNYYGLISYIVAIWSARKFQRECQSIGFDGSYGVIDRRYARGKCDYPNKTFKNFAKKYKLDPYKKARLGNKFPYESTNKEELLKFLLKRAIEEKIIERNSY